MRHRALRSLLGFGLVLASPVWSDQPKSVVAQVTATATSAWALDQYQQAKATEDPVARRLLLEHLFQALPETDVLWLRVKGQLWVLERLEGGF